MVSFPCPTTCPEVQVKYECVITSQTAQWNVSSSFGVGGHTTYGANDPIGLTKQISIFFTANKTGSTSFSLNFTADVDFNNSVMVICRDGDDPNKSTSSRQCTIELVGKRELVF